MLLQVPVCPPLGWLMPLTASLSGFSWGFFSLLQGLFIILGLVMAGKIFSREGFM